MHTHDIVGAIIGTVFVAAAIVLSRKMRIEHWVWSASLILLPLIYMGFGVLAADLNAIKLELLYGVPFILAGLMMLTTNIRYSSYAVAAFWLMHASYDFWHEAFFVNPGVWNWYPVACAVVDFVVFAYLVWMAGRLPQGKLEFANEVT